MITGISNAPLAHETTAANDPSRFAIFAYEPRLEDGCLELLRLTLGDSAVSLKTKEFWAWKHLQNPFGASECLCAVDPLTQRIVGLRMFMKWRFQAPDGTLVDAARAVDTATHPEYRRLGIFSTLTRQALINLTARRTGLVFNTPNRQSLPGYLKLGWHRAQSRALYFKILNPLNFARRLFRPRQPSEGVPAWDTCFKPAVRCWREFHEQFNDEIRAVTARWETNRRQTGYRTPRSLEYLNWRYGGHPHLSYGVFSLQDKDGLRGFVIMRPNRRYGLREVLITEMILREPKLSIGLQLLQEARRHISADWIIAHGAPRTTEWRLFLLAGFHRWPGHSIPFAIRPLSPSRPHHGRAGDWDLSLGDLEIF